MRDIVGLVVIPAERDPGRLLGTDPVLGGGPPSVLLRGDEWIGSAVAWQQAAADKWQGDPVTWPTSLPAALPLWWEGAPVRAGCVRAKWAILETTLPQRLSAGIGQMLFAEMTQREITGFVQARVLGGALLSLGLGSRMVTLTRDGSGRVIDASSPEVSTTTPGP